MGNWYDVSLAREKGCGLMLYVFLGLAEGGCISVACIATGTVGCYA